MSWIRRRRLIGPLTVAVASVVAACGTSPTASPQGAASAPGAESEGDGFSAVYAELEGLGSEQRHKRLVRLAQEEGELTIYSSNVSMPDVAPAFEAEFGIETNIWRAQSQDVSQRIHEEAQAGRVASDIIDNTAEYMLIAEREGLLAKYEGPVRESLPKIALGTGFIANQYTAFAVAWNTNLVGPGDRPTSYRDLAGPKWSKRLLIDPRHDAMFFALNRYFRNEGWSEDDILDLFRGIGKNAVLMEGGTARANSLVSGGHAVGLGSFIHQVDQLADEGGPIAWQPAVEPIYVEPVGSGLSKSAAHPAAALLFYEWVATDGQDTMASLSRLTTSEFTRGGRLDGVEVLQIDYGRYVNEREKWESRYHKLIGYR